MSPQSWNTRRQRPAGRRALIVDAATDLFARRGVKNVAMSDIAAAVGVGPSALYRHFRGKDDLLAAAVDQTLDRFADTLSDPSAGRAATLNRVADFAVAHRSTAILWEREVRQLPPELRTPRTRRLADLHHRFAHIVTGDASTDPAARLLARAALGALFSPAVHGVVLPDDQFRTLLVHVAEAILVTELPAFDPAVGAPSAGLPRATKREQILRAAVGIFADHTYAGTGMEMIAEAVGLSTSSVYNHFASKAEILEVALHRSSGYLHLTLDDILRAAHDEAAALRELVAVYAGFAVRHPGLVDALVTEIRSLGDRAEPLLQTQRDYLGEWVRLYCASRPGTDPATAQIMVQAALMAMNDVARDHDSAGLPQLSRHVVTFAIAALEL